MELLAKSNPKVSLKQHIDDALEVYELLRLSFPKIHKIVKDKDFWEQLRQSVIFHDLGKSHAEFQNLLLGKTNDWKLQRHELFSLPFVNALRNKNNAFVFYVVAGHHKDFGKLWIIWFVLCH